MIYDVLYGAATANPTSHTSAAAAPPPTSSRAATAHPWRKRAALTPKAITYMTHQRYFASNPQTSETILESQERSSKRRRPLKPFVQLITWRNFKRKFIRFPSHEVVIQWTAPPNAAVHITHVSQRRRRLGDPNNKIPKYRVEKSTVFRRQSIQFDSS